MVAGSAAFLSVGAAGVVLMNGPQAEQGAAEAALVAEPRAAVAMAPEPRPEARVSQAVVPNASPSRRNPP